MSTTEEVKENKSDYTKPSLSPYLYFKGNGNEAMAWYTEKIGATTEFKVTFKDGPPVAEEHKDCVMHAMMKIHDSVIMLSDDIGCYGENDATVVGNNVTLNMGYHWRDLEEMKKVFNDLSEGGKIIMPLEHQFWAATYGKFVDKFGITWSFNCHDADYQENKKARTD